MKLSLSNIKESIQAVEAYTRHEAESFGGLLLNSPGEESVAKHLFEATARLQVIGSLETVVANLKDSTDAEGLLRIQERLYDMACSGGSTQNSLIGEVFSAERRKYASQLLRSWFL